VGQQLVETRGGVIGDAHERVAQVVDGWTSVASHVASSEYSPTTLAPHASLPTCW
jgi:hypothetical protein